MGENSVGVIRLDAFKFEDMVAGSEANIQDKEGKK